MRELHMWYSNKQRLKLQVQIRLWNLNTLIWVRHFWNHYVIQTNSGINNWVRGYWLFKWKKMIPNNIILLLMVFLHAKKWVWQLIALYWIKHMASTAMTKRKRKKRDKKKGQGTELWVLQKISMRTSNWLLSHTWWSRVHKWPTVSSES